MTHERAPRRRHPAAAHEEEPGPAAETRPDLENSPEGPAGTEADAIRDLLQAAEQRYLRMAADFENFKRRKGQELEDRGRYASEEAARAMLPVLDNLRRAVAHAPEGGADDFFVSGLHLVVREFETVLERLGVSRVPGVGEPFDPSVHEAIGGEESDTVEHDTVVDELVPGYRLHDRLLRPAVVRVAHPRQPAPAA